MAIRNKRHDMSDTVGLNYETYNDYLDRLEKLATSIFEWTGLPDSMDARYLERLLYLNGQCALFKDDKLGFIDTACATSGGLNIYGLPTKVFCTAINYNTERLVYSGETDIPADDQCVMVMNNWHRMPTFSALRLFASRLTEIERAIDVNVKAQKTPVLVLCDDKQRLTLKNIYQQYDGNSPVIFGDKYNLDPDSIKSINTGAPFVASDLQVLKKEIMNEVLTYLGINNIQSEKRERLISGESSENNEVINLNLQSALAPRKLACEQFNKLFDMNIDVKVRSDLYNIIKQTESVITDQYKQVLTDDVASLTRVKETDNE